MAGFCSREKGEGFGRRRARAILAGIGILSVLAAATILADGRWLPGHAATHLIAAITSRPRAMPNGTALVPNQAAEPYVEPLLACNAVSCDAHAVLYSEIEADLAPWPRVSISSDTILASINTYFVELPWTVTIVVLIDNNGTVWVTRHKSPHQDSLYQGLRLVDPILLLMLRTLFQASSVFHLPPAEWIMSANDHPRGTFDEKGLPLPLFGVCRTSKDDVNGFWRNYDGRGHEILAPIGDSVKGHELMGARSGFEAMATAGGDGYDALLGLAPTIEAAFPWENRTRTAFWKGHLWGCSPFHRRIKCSRRHVVKLAHDAKLRATRGEPAKYGDGLVEASFTNQDRDRDKKDMDSYDYMGTFIPRSPEGPVSLFNHARFKYLLQLDGLSYSSRFAKLLAVGSLVLKEHSDRVEYYYRAIKPGVHYLSILSNPEDDDIIPVIEWAINHDAEAKRIAQNGHNFARSHLCKKARHCYWRRLLDAYSERLGYVPVKREGFTYTRLSDVPGVA